MRYINDQILAPVLIPCAIRVSAGDPPHIFTGINLTTPQPGCHHCGVFPKQWLCTVADLLAKSIPPCIPPSATQQGETPCCITVCTQCKFPCDLCIACHLPHLLQQTYKSFPVFRAFGAHRARCRI